jgi:hypothetical protein
MSTNSKNMYGRPVVFYNWAVALHSTLVVNHELRARVYAEKDKLRLLNSYATCLMNAVSCI